MKRNAAFLDTSALLALINSNDGLHGRALAVREDLDASGATLVTTEWVLTEFLNHTAGRPGRRAGLRTVDALRASNRTLVEPATTEDWRAALVLYRRRIDKEWSLVDCTSMLTCERYQIQRVFTHDAHFEQAGFRALLR